MNYNVFGGTLNQLFLLNIALSPLDFELPSIDIHDYKDYMRLCVLLGGLLTNLLYVCK